MKLHAEVTRITGEPAFLKRNYIDRAIEPAGGTPEEFARFIAGNRKIAAQIAKDSGQQPQ